MYQVVEVLVQREFQLLSYHARCKGIVCGGAFESPALLLVSVIGRREHVPKEGLYYSPVGQHSQDHVMILKLLLKHQSGYPF
jgi:choline dehydrogenase-like flavoprotein